MKYVLACVLNHPIQQVVLIFPCKHLKAAIGKIKTALTCFITALGPFPGLPGLFWTSNNCLGHLGNGQCNCINRPSIHNKISSFHFLFKCPEGMFPLTSFPRRYVSIDILPQEGMFPLTSFPKRYVSIDILPQKVCFHWHPSPEGMFPLTSFPRRYVSIDILPLKVCFHWHPSPELRTALNSNDIHTLFPCFILMLIWPHLGQATKLMAMLKQPYQ